MMPKYIVYVFNTWHSNYAEISRVIIGSGSVLALDKFNPLSAKFIRGNKNIYLHLISLPHTDMIPVVETLPQIRLTYSK